MADGASENRLENWQDRWENQDIGFHKTEVHEILLKHFPLLESESKPNQIFVPLCGKTLDMKWFADKGLTVVGVDGVKMALQEFFKEQNIEWTEEDAPAMGPNCTLLKSNDGKIRLYCGDIMLFNESVEGKFDAVWDRGSLVALNREDVPKYVKTIKGILSSKAKILVEVMEYDVSIMDEFTDASKPPPPFPMYEDEIKRLFEPECTIKFVESRDRQLRGKDIKTTDYLITKT